MTKMRRFGSIAALLAAGVLIGASADNVLSSTELRGLSPRQADRQFRRDLISILRPMQQYPRGNRRLVGNAWAETKAVATEYQPLCSRDTLSLEYEPISREGNSEDWPVRPSSVTVERSYRFVAAPRPDHLKAREKDGYFRSAFDSRCRAAEKVVDDNPWAGWFTAPSSERAMDAGFAMLALHDWAKTNAKPFWDCSGYSDKQVCKAASLAALTLDDIGSIEACVVRSPSEICIRLGKWDMVYTIVAVRTGNPMRAQDILSATAEQQIIVT